MSDVFVFLLTVIALLAIYGIAANRSKKDPVLRPFTDQESDGGVLHLALFSSSSDSSSHSHPSHSDVSHHAPADTGAPHGGFDSGHLDGGGGHH